MFGAQKTNPKAAPKTPKKGVGFPYHSKHATKSPKIHQSLASASAMPGGNAGQPMVACPSCGHEFAPAPDDGSSMGPEQATPSEGL